MLNFSSPGCKRKILFFSEEKPIYIYKKGAPFLERRTFLHISRVSEHLFELKVSPYTVHVTVCFDDVV